MPGVRDRNLRSGDLYEEVGILLLRTVALVSAIPRQEDVGIGAFVTLVKPEGSRRLLPDVSFVVQLKGASVGSVDYTDADAIAWITGLEIPLFIGRVSFDPCRIELYSTQRLHHILLEGACERIHLLLDPESELPKSSQGYRHANLGPPVHSWSLEDANRPEFLMHTYEILRPHVESMRLNRRLREIQYQKTLKWGTGKPPVDGGTMMFGSPRNDVRDILREMIPHMCRLLFRIQSAKRYDDFPVLLAMVDVPITDAAVVHLKRLKRLARLNLCGTNITDLALEGLATIDSLRWLNLERTRVTEMGITRLKVDLPDTEIVC